MTDNVTKGIEIKNISLENELNNSGNNTNVRYEDDDENKNFLVSFRDSGHEYIVERPSGKITLKGSNVIPSEQPVVLSSIKSWTSDSNEDFHKESIRKSIIEVEFVNYIPSPVNLNDTNCWDVSQEQNNSVIAWLDANKLFIGGEGGIKANEDSSNIFYNFNNLVNIAFNNNYDTSNVTNMIDIFYGCYDLENLNVSTFDTHQVTSMQGMFRYCMSLQTLDVSNFDTSNVMNMNAMFAGCRNLKVLDLSSFNTTNVTNTNGMFDAYSEKDRNYGSGMSLKNIYVGNLWNMSNVTDSKYMFQGCSKLVGGNGTKSSSGSRRRRNYTR